MPPELQPFVIPPTKALAMLGALRNGAINIIATSARNVRTILDLSQ